MYLSEFKNAVQSMDGLEFILPDGKIIPAHFHITEIGKIQKNFIDCGGTLRDETKISFQLWSSIDIHHRLKASKLIKIIEMAEEKLDLNDAEIEVEYQGDTIGKYGVEIKGSQLHLTSLKTDCLAKDNCGIPKPKLNLAELTSCCSGSDCC